jgi:YidC/Oxa1 family membrane protein insertase
MGKTLNIIKNTLIFLVVFLAVNSILNFFQGDKNEALLNEGEIILKTVDNEFTRREIVTLEIANFTDQPIKILNECPGEPLNVYKVSSRENMLISANPEISCENQRDIFVAAGAKRLISYDNWNHALFGEMGRFKVEAEIMQTNGETTTINSNEFLVVKEGLFKQAWYGLFYRPIYNGLIYIVSVLPGNSLFWAIVLLTLVLRTILLLPSQKAIRAQMQMQELQPKLQKIKEKYKGDQQRIALETMAVWKSAKVTPFGSCLPMLIQFPILIALFFVIQEGLNPDNVHLFYSSYENFSLNDINPIILGMDLTKANVFVLPFIVGGLQFLQMRTMRIRNKQNKNAKKEVQMATNMMSYIMPIMIALFTASLPAGVGIYWGTSTLYGIVQQQFISTKVKNKKKDKEPVVRVINNKNN